MRIRELCYQPVSAASEKLLLLGVAAANSMAVALHFETGRSVGGRPWYWAAFIALASAIGFARVVTHGPARVGRFFFSCSLLAFLVDIGMLWPHLPGLVIAFNGLTAAVFAAACRLAYEERRERAVNSRAGTNLTG